MINQLRYGLILLLVFAACLCCGDQIQLPGTALTPDQAGALVASLSVMRTQGLTHSANLGTALLKQGIWRAATADDVWIKESEKAGDTPFAYTLSPGRKPIAIVLAARFFTDTTTLGRAAVMIHEMGHYQAYVRTGRSDEYDGYKAEYDSYRQLGLSEKDGLIYFCMLDGAGEYVVPRDPSYGKQRDIEQFLAN